MFPPLQQDLECRVRDQSLDLGQLVRPNVSEAAVVPSEEESEEILCSLNLQDEHGELSVGRV